MAISAGETPDLTRRWTWSAMREASPLLALEPPSETVDSWRSHPAVSISNRATSDRTNRYKLLSFSFVILSNGFRQMFLQYPVAMIGLV